MCSESSVSFFCSKQSVHQVDALLDKVDSTSSSFSPSSLDMSNYLCSNYFSIFAWALIEFAIKDTGNIATDYEFMIRIKYRMR